MKYTFKSLLAILHMNEWEPLDYISFNSKIKTLMNFASDRMSELQKALKEKVELSYLDKVMLKVIDNLNLNIKYS